MEKILVIAGPTGIGETNLSVELAKTCRGGVISGDSMQVYKEISIGTARITRERVQEVPHYLIGFCSFTEKYSVKVFQEKAREYITEITKHGHLPVICGEAGLYTKPCLYDYQFIDQPQDTEFMNSLAERGMDEIWRVLSVIDPEACKNLHPRNRQRIACALAMTHTGERKNEIVGSQEHRPVYGAYIIGLTVGHSRLYERVNARVDTMVKQELLREIEQLHTLQEDVWGLQGFQGIGYKEQRAYVKDRESVDTCVERIKKDSHDFAKHQYTWFRNQIQVYWCDAEDENYREKVLGDVETWMKN